MSVFILLFLYMIDKIINFLQWIKSNDVLRRRLDFFISFLFIFLSASLAWNFYKDISYCYGDCGR